MEGEEEVKGMCVLCCVCGKKVLKRKIKGQTDEQSNQQNSQSFVHSPKYPQEAKARAHKATHVGIRNSSLEPPFAAFQDLQ